MSHRRKSHHTRPPLPRSFRTIEQPRDSVGVERPLMRPKQVSGLQEIIRQAIMNGQPPSYRPPRANYRPHHRLGSTIISCANIERARHESHLWGSAPLNDIKSVLQDNLPSTHDRPLLHVPVVGAVALRNGNHVTLALKLNAATCDTEARHMTNVVFRHSGVRLDTSEIGTHVSLAAFYYNPEKERFTIPDRVMSAVERARPYAVDLAPVQVKTVPAHPQLH